MAKVTQEDVKATAHHKAATQIPQCAQQPPYHRPATETADVKQEKPTLTAHKTAQHYHNNQPTTHSVATTYVKRVKPEIIVRKTAHPELPKRL